MNHLHKKFVLGGLNLLAIGAASNDATLLQPHYESESNPNQVQKMSASDMRKQEASHLEVYAGCKWGHAAFDPIQVDSEVISHEIQSLYATMT